MKKEKENIDIIFLGSSRTYRGINSYQLSNNLDKNVFNIAYEQSSYITSYYLLNEVCKTNNPEMVCIEVSAANLIREKSTEDICAYKTMTGSTKTEFADAVSLKYKDLYLLNFVNYLENFSNHKFIKNVRLKFMKDYSLYKGLQNNKTTYYGKGTLLVDKVVSEDKHLALPLSYGSTEKWEEERVNSMQYDYLLKIIDFCKGKGIKICLYNPPFPYSVTEEMADVFTGFDEYVKENLLKGKMVYVDFAKTKKEFVKLIHAYFYDGNHCNKDGAEVMTPIITEVISNIINGTYESDDYFYSTFEEMIADYEQEEEML